MKAIKDLDSLLSRLEKENDEWRRMIYDATGVILTKELYLFSKCGYISLDYEMEFSYSAGAETTEYCYIDTIDKMIEYIKTMDVYNEALIDKSFGSFSMADLFWAIQNRILLQPDNLNEAGEQDWAFSLVLQEGDFVTFRGAFIPCDAVEIPLDVNKISSVDEALIQFTSELNSITESMDGFVVQKVFSSDSDVPDTYEKLMKKIFPDGDYSWLEGYDEVEISASVCSEREDVSIGFGISYDHSKDSLKALGIDWIFEGMADSFWENAYEFEKGMNKVEELEEQGTKDALQEVFGLFRIKFETNVKGWSPEFVIAPDEVNDAMYSLLSEL